MNVAGWILLIISCGSIAGLAVFCFWKVLTLPKPEEELHATLDIDTHDLNNGS